MYEFFTITIEGSTMDHSMDNVIGDHKFLTYKNIDYGIKIDYPGNWIYQNYTSSNIIYFISPDELTSFGILINNIPEYYSLNEYITDYLSKLSESTAIINLSYNETILLNNPAYEIEYVTKDVNTQEESKTKEIIIIHGDKLYNIIYSIINDQLSYYLPLVEKMLDSFRIISDNRYYIIR